MGLGLNQLPRKCPLCETVAMSSLGLPRSDGAHTRVHMPLKNRCPERTSVQPRKGRGLASPGLARGLGFVRVPGFFN